MKRFGKSWGAPICEDLEVIEPPVGLPCSSCNRPIGPKDSGVVMPLVEEVDSVWRTREIPQHLGCFLDGVIPHGPECERCRGLGRDSHNPSCAHRTEGAVCNCEKGRQMTRLLDSRTTLADAQSLAEELGLGSGYLLDLMRYRQMRREAERGRG